VELLRQSPVITASRARSGRFKTWHGWPRKPGWWRPLAWRASAARYAGRGSSEGDRVILQAKGGITSPDPHYEHRKASRDGWIARAHQAPTIAVVFQDESWFSGDPRWTVGW